MTTKGTSKLKKLGDEKKFDPVQKPAHYNAGGIECIDALKAATINLVGLDAVCTANAIKYLWRWKMKNGTEDLRKAIWYIDRLLKEYPERVAEVVHGAAQPPFVPQTGPTCVVCGKKNLSTAEGDGGDECQLSDGSWVCSGVCWDVVSDGVDLAVGAADGNATAKALCPRVETPPPPVGEHAEWFPGTLGKGSRRFIPYHVQVALMNDRADSDNHRPMDVNMWDDAMSEHRQRMCDGEYHNSNKRSPPPGPPDPPPKPPGNKVG